MHWYASVYTTKTEQKAFQLGIGFESFILKNLSVCCFVLFFLRAFPKVLSLGPPAWIRHNLNRSFHQNLTWIYQQGNSWFLLLTTGTQKPHPSSLWTGTWAHSHHLPPLVPRPTPIISLLWAVLENLFLLHCPRISSLFRTLHLLSGSRILIPGTEELFSGFPNQMEASLSYISPC